MVDRIEQYDDTLKVILRPTKCFPIGYFYCDSEDEDLVRNFSWYLTQRKKIISVSSNSFRSRLTFHRELTFKYLGYYPECVDHVSGVEIDNTDSNLNIVTPQQNCLNKPTKGYKFSIRYNNFQPRIIYYREELRPFGVVYSEVEACQLQHFAETDFLRLKMQENYYMYNFLLDRRQDLDILDLERTKKISPEEATYKHVIRHANAWHYFRYNLEQYFKDNKIPVPDYDLDDLGFMVDKVTRKRLCPFVYKD